MVLSTSARTSRQPRAPYSPFRHKRFLIPSCTVDLTREHPRPCLQYHIHRCLGPCVPGLTTDERYAEAAHDVRLFLDGRRHDLVKSLEQRMSTAAEKELYEQAAAYRDLLRTLEDIEERQRIASAKATTPTSSPTTPSRRSSLRISSTCAPAASSTAANSIGKISKNFIQRNLFPLF